MCWEKLAKGQGMNRDDLAANSKTLCGLIPKFCTTWKESTVKIERFTVDKECRHWPVHPVPVSCIALL